jgi:hypothetical protein
MTVDETTFCPVCRMTWEFHPWDGCDEASPNGQVQVGSHDLNESRRRTSWSASDLLDAEFAEPRFAVPQLIPEGLAFMGGAPKLGKSWMALGLGIACSSPRGRALGQIPVAGGDVLYLALEDSPRRLQGRLRTLLAGEDASARLQLETEWPRLDEGGIEKLDAWIEDSADPRLVLIDVWARIRSRRAHRSDYYQADYDAASPLQGLAISRGVAVVAMHHTRKAGDEDAVATLQGTFGTAGAADTIIVVKRSRGKADATLHVTGRDVEERELALTFAPEAGTWTLLGEAAEYALGETRAELLAVVREHGRLTPKQAAEISGISHDLVRQTMRRMAQDGQLQGDRGTYRTPVTAVTPSQVEGQSDASDTGSKEALDA